MQTSNVNKTIKAINKSATKEAKAAKSKALKDFRHQVAVLKKKQVLSKKYDARSVTPSKYLRSQIASLADILTGKATAAKVSKEDLKNYKNADYKIKNGRVIVPKQPGEKITVSHGKIYQTKALSNGEIQIIKFPIPFENLEQYLNSIKNGNYDKLKNETDRWAFQFYGRNSLTTFSNIEDMINQLSNYGSVKDAIGSKPSQQNDVYRNLAIVRIKARKDWKRTEPSKERKQYTAQDNARRREKRRAKYNAVTGYKSDIRSEKRKARDKAQYDKLKSNTTAYKNKLEKQKIARQKK